VAKPPIKRDDDISKRVDEDDLADLYKDVCKGFEEQRDRSDEIADNWDMYNCRISEKQFYNGTSQIATPFVQDAVEARVTRFTNQLFPQSGRFVEVTTNGEDPPQAIQSLLEMYVRKRHFRTDVIPELLRNGDIEGQWNVYVSWSEHTRHVTGKVQRQPTTGGQPNPASEPVSDVADEEVVDSLPDIEVISDPDVLILPQTCKTAADALTQGGSVTIIRRWSKKKIRKAIKDGDIRKEDGEALIDAMTTPKAGQDGKDIAKEQLDAAGIKDRGKVALIYESWAQFDVGTNHDRLCRVYFGVPDITLGVKLNPFWNDRCPLISAPLKKKTGASKGRAPVCAVSDFWILANDTINEGADTSHFSAMPIVMTDPVKNPRVDTMVLGLASVWEVSPSDTEIVKFPELWENALNRTLAIKDQIFQTLGVNPSMIPQSTGKPKRNQAELAIEQQVDILTTADVVGAFEEGVATPLIQMIAEHDQQFRDEAVSVRVYGEMGLQANMEMVEPLQLGNRYEYRWYGVEAARNAAQMQQQISFLNVAKEIPPALYQGYKMNAAPMLVRAAENVFGPRVGPRIFEKIKEISTDPWTENEMLIHGLPVEIAPSDDDLEHIQTHMHVLQSHADVHGEAQKHIAKHQQQMQAKMMAQMQQAQPGGGGGAGPKPGASPGQARPAKQPPGAIHKDRMPAAGVVDFPRKT
jgi:hypothetical protein